MCHTLRVRVSLRTGFQGKLGLVMVSVAVSRGTLPLGVRLGFWFEYELGLPFLVHICRKNAKLNAAH